LIIGVKGEKHMGEGNGIVSAELAGTADE